MSLLLRRLLCLLAVPAALAVQSSTEWTSTEAAPGTVARVKALNDKGLEG